MHQIKCTEQRRVETKRAMFVYRGGYFYRHFILHPTFYYPDATLESFMRLYQRHPDYYFIWKEVNVLCS